MWKFFSLWIWVIILLNFWIFQALVKLKGHTKSVKSCGQFIIFRSSDTLLESGKGK